MPSEIAFVWFTKESYPRLLEVVVDRHRFSDAFEEWRKVAERRFELLRMHSLGVVKVVVDPEELLEWCIAHGRAVDAKSRSQFAALKLVEQNSNRGATHLN